MNFLKVFLFHNVATSKAKIIGNRAIKSHKERGVYQQKFGLTARGMNYIKMRNYAGFRQLSSSDLNHDPC